MIRLVDCDFIMRGTADAESKLVGNEFQVILFQLVSTKNGFLHIFFFQAHISPSEPTDELKRVSSGKKKLSR